MRKFTLTAIAIKDEKVAGVFQILEQTPKFDGAVLSHTLSKFIELPYQKLIFDPSKVVFVDLHWLHSNFGKLSVEELAFSVWRAATALRNSKALEVEGVKHGSNWLVRLDDEPFDVKFVLEDQAQNYVILNVLPVLEPTVVINESGWLATSVPAELDVAGDETYALESTEPTIGSLAAAALRPILNGVWDTSSPKEATEREQALDQLGYRTIGHWPVTEETVEVVQLDEGTERDPSALLSAAPQCTETGIRDSSQLPKRYSEQIVEPGQESMPGFKFSNEFGDKGVVDTGGFARPKEVPEHNQAVGGLGHESPALEVGEDTAETAVLPDTVLEPGRISSVGVHLQMKKEFEFSQEDPGPTEILAALKKGYMDGAKSTALDSGMFEKPVAEGFAEGLGEIHDQMLESRSASKALLSDEQEGFLAEASLRGQTAGLVMTDNGTFILSKEVHEAAKAMDVEYVDIASSDEYRKFCEEHKASEAEALAGTTTDNYMSPVQVVDSLTKEEVEDVPTTHVELDSVLTVDAKAVDGDTKDLPTAGSKPPLTLKGLAADFETGDPY